MLGSVPILFSAASIERKLALGVALVVALGYGYFFHYYPEVPNPNESSRVYLTMAIVDDGTLAIDGPIERFGIAWDHAIHEGRTYSDKAPGLSFLGVPIYGAMRLAWWVVGSRPSMRAVQVALRWSLSIIPSALFSCGLFLFLAPILPDPRLRFLLALLYAFGTPARIYGPLLFGHQLAAVLAAGGLMLLDRSLDAKRSAPVVLTAGAAIGLAFMTEYPAIAAALGGGALIWLRRGRSSIYPYLVGVGVFIAAALLYHALAFGGALTPGYAKLPSTFARGHAEGLFGIRLPSLEALFGVLGSLRRGLFVLSPWLLLAAPGFVLLGRQRRPLAAAVGVTVVVWGFLATGFVYWHGGDSAGPRHLTGVLPFLVIAAAPAFAELSRAREAHRLLASSAAVFSLALVNFVSVTFSYFSPSIENPYRDVTLELWRRGWFPESVGSRLGLGGLAAVAPYLLLVFGIALFSCFAWSGRARPGRLLYPALLVPLCFLVLLTRAPEGRSAASAHELVRYLVDLGAEGGASPSLLRRGNVAALLGDGPAAVRHYLDARGAHEPNP